MNPLKTKVSLQSAVALLAALGMGAAAHAQTGPIKIGVLAPVTGPLATPGKDMVEGWKLFWEQAGHIAGAANHEVTATVLVAEHGGEVVLFGDRHAAEVAGDGAGGHGRAATIVRLGQRQLHGAIGVGGSA